MVLGQDRTVKPGGEVAGFVVDGSDLAAGDGDLGHQEPVAEQDGDRDAELVLPVGVQEDERDDEIANRDPLKHSGNSHCREIVGYEVVTREIEADDADDTECG